MSLSYLPLVLLGGVRRLGRLGHLRLDPESRVPDFGERRMLAQEVGLETVALLALPVVTVLTAEKSIFLAQAQPNEPVQLLDELGKLLTEPLGGGEVVLRWHQSVPPVWLT